MPDTDNNAKTTDPKITETADGKKWKRKSPAEKVETPDPAKLTKDETREVKVPMVPRISYVRVVSALVNLFFDNVIDRVHHTVRISPQDSPAMHAAAETLATVGIFREVDRDGCCVLYKLAD